MKVQVKTATGAWTTAWSRDSTNPPQTTFITVSLKLSSYKSTGTQVRFSFNSIDSYPRSHPGWAVEDVLVKTGGPAAPSVAGLIRRTTVIPIAANRAGPRP